MRVIILMTIILARTEAMAPFELVDKLAEINEQLSMVVDFVRTTMEKPCLQTINEASTIEDVVNCFSGINTNCALLSCGNYYFD